MNSQDITLFFDQSQDIIGIVDQNLRYVGVNLELCRYWGVQRDDVVNRPVREIVGEEAYDKAIGPNMERCLRGENIAYEKWIDFPGTGRRHVNVKYTPRHDEDGNVKGVFIIARDTTDNKKLEAELLQKTERYDNILSASEVGLMLFNPDMTIQWHNRQMNSFTHTPITLGDKCYEVLHQNTPPCENCIVKRSFATGERFSNEFYNTALERWFFFASAPVLDDNGQVQQVLGHMLDVSDQKEAEATLHAKQAELSSIFKATRAGLGIIRDRVFVTANDYLFDMVGYDWSEIIGHNINKLYVTQEDFDAAGDFFYHGTNQEAGDTYEVRWRRKDGTELDVLVTLTPMDSNDPSAGAAFAAMDVTDRKRTEEAIRHSEARFRELFEHVDIIAVQGYDRERRVMYWNPASETLYGYTREEAIGQLLDELIIPDPMKEIVQRDVDAWMNGGPAIPAGELFLQHKDGSSVPVYSSHVMQKTSTGEKYMYCIDVDLSEIKRIHNQLIQAKDEAEAANKSKSEFLANMSHEIRTPLNGIKGMLALIQSSNLDEQQAEYAQAGLESVDRLGELLSDILDISQVEAGKLVLGNEQFDLPGLAQQVKGLFQLTSDNAKVTLSCHVYDDVPQYVSGDSARLRQILTNLVGNGLKYTDSGEVRLEVSRLSPIKDNEERIYFAITDTGIGIDDPVIDKLFAPFFQGSQGYTRQYQGAGLGLAICKRLISLMGGHMAVESTQDHGTTAHVVLSFGKCDRLETPLFCSIGNDDDLGHGLNILVAEDDRINAIVCKRLLEKAGAKVEVAQNGREALDMLREGDFNAVFMDVQMPIMDGAKATQAIRAGETGDTNKDIFICAVTAYTMMGDREKFLEMGMDDYISKPMELDDLKRILCMVHGYFTETPN
ncbi:PAS domain S-box protein [Pseudodesulfovibrio sp. zrk46]|uniref:PAS domain-containing hybrid sensor histidine kinase/response regulator n=1 Tax=Pseudodesulfovibrio sp. zrk46 TaxID=2725288 RepID=UPI001449F446|nr:PAS domain S-box protein [Pseudodesulfovibrio sp. zrk46]QJB55357.1 PAS domain S-box protein [Pseudodesulfovibrio sp. zrk46]